MQLIFVFVGGFAVVYGQAGRGEVEFANIQEDVRLLTQRIGDLQLRVEQLERENSELRAKTAGSGETYATVAQLNAAVADMNRVLKASIAASKQETLLQVSEQMEKLGRQMNAALDALSARHTATPVVAPAATADDTPKDSVKYVVQKGDTLASIAKKTGSKVSDIMSANKLQNSGKILEGQALLIPVGK